MKMLAIFASFFLILSTCFGAQVPPRGQPGHEKPYGDMLSIMMRNERQDGWIDSDIRSIVDAKGNQFIFQGFSRFKPERQAKILCFWMLHEVIEEVGTIGPYKLVWFHPLWFNAITDERRPIFGKNRKDALVTIVENDGSFKKRLMSPNIVDYNMVDAFGLPENVLPWTIAELDGDGFYELICVNLSLADMAGDMPHALSIYKPGKKGFEDVSIQLKKTTDVWDKELESAARECKNDKRISECVSLVLSLKLHGHPDPISVVSEIMLNPAGYAEGKVPVKASSIIDELRSRLK